MKILMELTPHIVTVDGVECRIWNAVTETNTQCFVLVHRIAVANPGNQKELSELLEVPLPDVMVLTS